MYVPHFCRSLFYSNVVFFSNINIPFDLRHWADFKFRILVSIEEFAVVPRAISGHPDKQ